MTAIDVRTPDTHTAITCPDCGGAGETMRDWRYDTETGRHYPQTTELCGRCNAYGEVPVETTPCDGCPQNADPFPVEDNQCTHGLALCEDHRDVCTECVLDQQDVDLDPYDDPWDER